VDLNPKKGRFVVAKFADTKLSVIHPRTARFTTIKACPGPFTYREGDSINGDSKYISSRRVSNGRRVFSKSARGNLWGTIETPGPGSYK
jgi:hypothetical protein